MRKILFFIPILALGLCFSSCKKKVEGAKAEVKEAAKTATPASTAKTFTVDASKSSITWTGSKVVGSNHQGKISLTNGSIQVQDGNVQAGNFTIDMNSIVNTDQEAGKGKEKLEGHLKSPDFFDIAKHPTATFTVSSVAPVTGTPGVTHNITGNLNLKGVSKSVTFGANVNIGGNRFMAVTPAFKINRNDWGVVYGNSSIAGIAKDNIISDDIALVINLAGTAQ